ncbi:hypothetical protein ACIA5G_19165 [Amycolatopsis sp. NPDC051758]|uniref:hypothetical protein n=1 Tax=Amycolatopsis sp. NPDC051758 TaxID=3363935 RepID=UPI0037882877
MRPTPDTWALTPLGEATLDSKASHVQVETLAADLSRGAGSELGQQRHALIPAFLGPPGVAGGLSKILTRSSFENNVMLITRFPRGPEDHYLKLIARLKEAVSAHGLVLQMASDGNAEDMLWSNVVTYMWACKYAIVIMDNVDGFLNSNVLIEIGGMLMSGRRCAILLDKSVPKMPSDLVGHIYKLVDLTQHDSCADEIHKWIRNDLGLSECRQCPAMPA